MFHPPIGSGLCCVWLVLGGMPAAAATPLDQAINEARPISRLEFATTSSGFLPGKGRGTPGESLGSLGIALVFSQNNYWESNEYSASGYNVRFGRLTDSEGRLQPVDAYQVSPPTHAANYQFTASGNQMFLKFPSAEEMVVYGFSGEIPEGSAGKPNFVYGNGTLVEEAVISAGQIIPGQWTAIPGLRLDSLTRERTFFALPRSVRVRPTTPAATGLEVSELAESSVARVAQLSWDVGGQSRPYDTGQDPGPGAAYGSQNRFLCTSEADGALSVLWKDETGQKLKVTTLTPDLMVRTFDMPVDLGLLGSATRDAAGHWYYLTVGPGKSPPMMLVKTDGTGVEVRRASVSPLANDLNVFDFAGDANGARLSLSGGRLCLLLARRMHAGSDGLNHQGSIVAVFNSETLALVKNLGQNSSHSFDSRILVDGDQFITMSLGDNYPRGIVLHRVAANNQMTGRVVFTYKTEHPNIPSPYRPLPAGQWSNDNRTYTDLGGLEVVGDGYGVLFSGEKSTDNRLATSALNESRNVGYVLVRRDFTGIPQSQVVVPAAMILSQGENSPLFGYYTFDGDFTEQQNRGVRWLTAYADKTNEHAARPQLVRLADDRLLVMWEKWSASRYLGTRALVADALGQVVETETDFGATRFSRGDSLIRSGRSLVGVTSNGRALTWTFIQPALWQAEAASDFQITGITRGAEGAPWRLTFRSQTGGVYFVQSSTTLAAASWLEVPGSRTTAVSELSEVTIDSVLPHRFFRVVREGN